MKQTAVEWLFEQLPTIDKYDPYYADIITQAKAMEKEQIFDAYITSHISMMSAEQYYYETFKQQKDV